MKPLAQMSGLTAESEDEITGDTGYAFMMGRIDSAEFHARLSRRLGLDISADRFFDIWSSVIVRNDEIEEIVGTLHGRYRLVVGSNTDPIHYARSLEVQPALRFFADALLSYELGHSKPDPAFFRVGLERISIRPEDCVFIDDRSDNVEAARTLGMTGIEFSSAEQLESELTNLGIVPPVP